MAVYNSEHLWAATAGAGGRAGGHRLGARTAVCAASLPSFPPEDGGPGQVPHAALLLREQSDQWPVRWARRPMELAALLMLLVLF